MHTFKLAAVATAFTLGVWMAAQAQEPPRKERDPAPATGVTTPAHNDAKILQWVKIDCEGIRECAELAAERTQNAEVKAFAQKVVDDHKRWEEACKQRHGDKVTAAYVNPEPRKIAEVVKDDGASRDGRLAYSPVDFVDVKKKVCSRMKDLGTKYMKELKAEDFDRAFLTHIQMAHEAAITGIDAVSGSASTELADSLKQGKTTLQEHLKAAENLNKPRQGN
ncbi:MAG TPA: DUF4142 domain-containing protein [Planctomycetia bacterium]|jgi:predicted outer membrane protein|nr:DUF4142 domain-containing protein [Planctomycetia bacterium]